MTVMHGERVLKYGYPKVHDGKNVVYDLRHSDPTLGIDEKTDAFIGGANWGQYYVAAIGVKLAELTSDIFTKTAIIRTVFAFIGLAGLAIFAFLTSQFFSTRSSRAGFLTLFVFIELISVPLVLHLREARYYPVTIFLTAFIIFIYIRYSILKKGGYMIYATLLSVSLVLLFVTFSPVYFIFLGAIFFYESAGFIKDLFSNYTEKHGQPGNDFKYFIRTILPLIFSLIAVSPLIFFFRTFYIADAMAQHNALLSRDSTWNMYWTNISTIWKYVTSLDLIYLAIFLKLCQLISFIKLSFRRDVSASNILNLNLSAFLTFFFAVYFFAIARIPNFTFTRYFIPLQPVLAVIIILDLALVYNLISLRQFKGFNYYKVILLIIFAGFILTNISRNTEQLKGHIYELSHQYKGPLDYLIPFIKETYRDTDNLVIATNYEETSFMYYLNSKIIIGFVGNNLAQDILEVPDIIIYRKGWGNFKDIFLSFVLKQRYQRISFPVFDNQVNNIPETNSLFVIPHRFNTSHTEDESMKVDIYLRM